MCTDEDPDNKDRVYGGKASRGNIMFNGNTIDLPWIALKDSTKDGASISDFNWFYYVSPSSVIITCQFTPVASTTHGHKMIASLMEKSG